MHVIPKNCSHLMRRPAYGFHVLRGADPQTLSIAYPFYRKKQKKYFVTWNSDDCVCFFKRPIGVRSWASFSFWSLDIVLLRNGPFFCLFIWFPSLFTRLCAHYISLQD